MCLPSAWSFFIFKYKIVLNSVCAKLACQHRFVRNLPNIAVDAVIVGFAPRKQRIGALHSDAGVRSAEFGLKRIDPQFGSFVCRPHKRGIFVCVITLGEDNVICMISQSVKCLLM